MTKRTVSKTNVLAEAATKSLASQPNNIIKGFDVTKIDTIDPDILEQLLAVNDLSVLTPAQRVKLIRMMCESLGLNPLTRPLQFVEFKTGDTDSTTAKVKLSIYATKECTEQLRKIHGVSVEDLKREILGDICMVTAYVKDKSGRTDAAVGAVALEKPGKAPYMYNGMQQPGWAAVPFDAAQKANALMKCETKAKRRATLSICGLGFLDETQIEDLTEPKVIPITEADIVASEKSEEQKPDKAAEEAEFLASIELSKEIKDELKSAKTVSELTSIRAKHIDGMSDQLQAVFKGELTAAKSRINRAQVAADMEAATASDGKQSSGGLFRKKNS